jgi:hypothetical protein
METLLTANRSLDFEAVNLIRKLDWNHSLGWDSPVVLMQDLLDTIAARLLTLLGGRGGGLTEQLAPQRLQE